MVAPVTNSGTRSTREHREHMDRGPARPGPFDDPFVKCMNGCDKINDELMQLACRIVCLFANK